MVKTNVLISTFQTSLGANVERNPEIKDGINRTNFLGPLVMRQREGSTLIQFGDGSAPKLMIAAGIHGNEEESMIAAMNYADFLNSYCKTNKLNGTIYVIPFLIPQTAAVNLRNFGWQGRVKDPNRICHLRYTPGWKLIDFCRREGINYILDVHSAGGSEMHRNGFIISTRGRAGEQEWAEHIRRETRCYVIQGGSHRGMVRGAGHRHGINAITLEVERDRGSTVEWAAVMYRLIESGVKYVFPEFDRDRISLKAEKEVIEPSGRLILESVSVIAERSQKVSNFIREKGRVPKTVKFNGEMITVSTFNHAMVMALLQISSGTDNPVKIGHVSSAINPSGELPVGELKSSEFMNLARLTDKFIKREGRMPNFVRTSIGIMNPSEFTDIYSRILAFYHRNKRLPLRVRTGKR